MGIFRLLMMAKQLKRLKVFWNQRIPTFTQALNKYFYNVFDSGGSYDFTNDYFHITTVTSWGRAFIHYKTIKDHVYLALIDLNLLKGYIHVDLANTYRDLNTINVTGGRTIKGSLFVANANSSELIITNRSSYEYYLYDLAVIDLTEMFNNNIPSEIVDYESFKKYIPTGINPFDYNEGTWY